MILLMILLTFHYSDIARAERATNKVCTIISASLADLPLGTHVVASHAGAVPEAIVCVAAGVNSTRDLRQIQYLADNTHLNRLEKSSK